MMRDDLPSGTVTFLFTDIQGSTQIWDSFPDEMRHALATHDGIIGEAVEAAEGAVIKSTGDGLFAAFSSARSAVEAAVDAQKRLAAYEWDPVIGSIEVRMAMHTDQAEAKDGDYHGGAINRTARIEAAGHGGQILLSGAAASAVIGQLPPDTELIELGTHQLRGLSRPEAIHQLVVASLRSSFPPLRTTSVAAGVLPEFATSFVGRAVDIRAIGDQLGSPDCRVLTVLGPGGIGKTRLSVEAARLVGQTSGAVAHFVPLTSVPTPDGIVGEIADSLNFTVDLHLSSVVDETTQVLDLLKKQRMVLVLDNFEHLVSGAAFVTRMVEAAPEVDVIVTSRERLGIGSEWIYEVGGLTLEGGSAADQSDAVELFLERARRAGGIVSNDDADQVAALCLALGGMPLAIELAAAWTPVISVDEIVSEVQTSLDILAGSRADLPERHRSVRAAFEQSWNRLEPDLQDSFSKLTIFPAPFTREAAAEVTATPLPTLMALINKSLVHRAALDTYDVHPLLRELGLEGLGDQRPAVARKHGEYYLERLLGRASQLAGSAEQIAVKDELAAELGNLRPATIWAVDNLPPEKVVEITKALQEFYFLASWAQAIDHFETMAQAVETAVGSGASAQDDRYLWAKTYAMSNLSQFGNVDQVTTGIDRLMPSWEERGGLGLAWALTAVGIAQDMAGQLEQAREALERALAVGLEGDTLLQLIHSAWHGWVIIEQGDAEQARAIWREGLANAEAANHQSGRAYLLSKLGVAADELGDHEEAANLHQESREIFVKAGDLGGEGYTLSRLSRTYWLLGDYAKAQQYGEEGLAKFDDINHRWGVAVCWCRIGMAEVSLDDPEAATNAFLTGMDLAMDNNMQAIGYYALLGMGKVFAARGRIEQAVQLLSYNVQAPQNPYAGLAQEALGALGDQATDEAMAAGAAMTMDEAIALARAGSHPSR